MSELDDHARRIRLLSERTGVPAHLLIAEPGLSAKAMRALTTPDPAVVAAAERFATKLVHDMAKLTAAVERMGEAFAAAVAPVSDVAEALRWESFRRDLHCRTMARLRADCT